MGRGMCMGRGRGRSKGKGMVRAGQARGKG